MCPISYFAHRHALALDTLAPKSQCSRCTFEEGKKLYSLSNKAALVAVMSSCQTLTSSFIGYNAGLASLPLPQS